MPFLASLHEALPRQLRPFLASLMFILASLHEALPRQPDVHSRQPA